MNAKEKEQILLGKIANNFNQYLKQGEKFNFSSFSQDIDPNLNINDIQRLLRIHFVLTKKDDDYKMGVIDFVTCLHERLQRIKTTLKANPTLFDGEIRGNVDWGKTFSTRNNRDPRNHSLFVCTQIERDYDIPENLVLKRLLQIIHEIITNDLRNAFQNEYDWIYDWIDDKKLKEILKSSYLRNVYLKRIGHKKIIINEHMINRAKNSRFKIYREAAELLVRYNKLLNYDFDDSEAKSLLKNTFIKPNKKETLFELYWIIEIINQFENVKLEILEKGRSCVARWKSNGYYFEIFHNSSAAFSFNPKVFDPAQYLENGTYFNREFKQIKKYEELTGKNYFGNLRPDIVLTRKNTQGILDLVFIGEVKDTTSREYAYQGLKELLTYIALIQKNSDYIDDDKKLRTSSGKIIGCLFTDEVLNFSIKSDECIRHIKFGERLDIF